MTFAHPRRATAPERCHNCAVRAVGLCNWFDATGNSLIASRTIQTRFAQGAPILIQGEPVERVGVILSGLAKLVLVDERGDEHLIQLLHAGELVGDPFQSENVFSVEAATELELCWLRPAVLADAIGQCPAAYRCHLEATTRQANELKFSQVASRGRNAVQRLAYWIFVQLPDRTAPGPLRLQIVLTRRDLASLLEMTVETLCRALHQLEQRQAIHLETPEILEITSREKLRAIGRGDDDRLRATLLEPGWEWGARTLPSRPRLAVVAPCAADAPAHPRDPQS